MPSLKYTSRESLQTIADVYFNVELNKTGALAKYCVFYFAERTIRLPLEAAERSETCPPEGDGLALCPGGLPVEYLCSYTVYNYTLCICVYVYVYAYVYAYIYIYICICIGMYVCMYVCMYACTYVRTYVCVNILYVYIHTHTCMLATQSWLLQSPLLR